MYASNPLLVATLLDPGMILFGVLLVLFGAALLAALLLRSVPDMAYPLASLLLVIDLTMVGHIILNLYLPADHTVPASLASMSALFLAHRWFVIELSKILLFTSAIILFVYGPRIIQPHARHYFVAVQVSVFGAFVLALISAVESIL